MITFNHQWRFTSSRYKSSQTREESIGCEVRDELPMNSLHRKGGKNASIWLKDYWLSYIPILYRKDDQTLSFQLANLVFSEAEQLFFFPGCIVYRFSTISHCKIDKIMMLVPKQVQHVSEDVHLWLSVLSINRNEGMDFVRISSAWGPTTLKRPK